MIHDSVSITIVDGQNNESIVNWADNDYHPCLAEPMALDKEITITFGSDITSFSDWFPDICWDIGNATEYENEFMFDGAQKWTINNLVVEDYVASDWWYIMRSGSEHSKLQCLNCSFVDIADYGQGYNLFDTFGSLHFEGSTFSGIDSMSTPMIGATHTDGDTGVSREFSMINCSFIDIQSAWAFMFLDLSYNDVGA